MRHHTAIGVALLLIVTLATVLAACGSKGTTQHAEQSPAPSTTAPAATPPGQAATDEWLSTAHMVPLSARQTFPSIAAALPPADTYAKTLLMQLSGHTSAAVQSADITSLDKFFRTPGFSPNI